MKPVFIFLFLNLTGFITYKIININKKKILTDLSNNSVHTQTDLSKNSKETQTELSNIDMSILLEYKKALENIYDDNVKYEWKFV